MSYIECAFFKSLMVGLILQFPLGIRIAFFFFPDRERKSEGLHLALPSLTVTHDSGRQLYIQVLKKITTV